MDVERTTAARGGAGGSLAAAPAADGWDYGGGGGQQGMDTTDGLSRPASVNDAAASKSIGKFGVVVGRVRVAAAVSRPTRPSVGGLRVSYVREHADRG